MTTKNTESTNTEQAHLPSPTEPWYKSPWLLLVLLIPAIAVIASLNMLRLASQGSDSAPHSFWSKEGLGIQGEEHLLEKARAQNLQGQLQIDAISGELTVLLNQPAQLESLTFRLLIAHATLKNRDQHIPLTLSTALSTTPSTLSTVSPAPTLNTTGTAIKLQGQLTARLHGKYFFYLTASPTASTDTSTDPLWLLKGMAENLGGESRTKGPASIPLNSR